MADVRPFRALRPRDDLAGDVIAPPYDVLTLDEARALATNPRNFVHVTRSEVDLPDGADPHGQAAYDRARVNLDQLVSDGVLVRDDAPTYLLYGQVMGAHRQVGVLAACSVGAYDDGTIKKHEFTRPDKEDDRTHHMEVLDAQVGLVFLAHRAHAGLAAIVARLTQAAPAWRVTTEDGVEHALWPVPLDDVDSIRDAFAELPALYIADGHHRSAAASRVHAHRRDAPSAWFLAGLFPDDALQVMAYNRVVHDLDGHTVDDFLAQVAARFTLTAGRPVPTRRGDFSMYLAGRWYTLTARPGLVTTDDPVATLDASVLQDHLLAPILGIDDPRRSERITFVGGIRGPQALVKAVDAGAAVAFHLFPTGLDQLFDVADAGKVMPPKSTWFEPKLREGVAVRLLDEA
ncbi:MAG: DUF1015 domain-containing protein [Alphaproteobacteria bacterium]|nr:DUF1015 domain-containing protein [Alphaproteobacteria bacterium]